MAGGMWWRALKRFALGVVVLLSSGTLLYVLTVLLLRPWLDSKEPVGAPVFPSNLANNLLLLAHVLTAIPCVALGPWLMAKGFRNRHLALHRRLGKIYVYTVLASAVIGLVLASSNIHGWVARFGFGTLAVAWFTTTTVAWRTIVARDEVAHRRWMLRSYAISLAVVTVRFLVWPPPGFTREQWYPIMTWACWVPNLLIGEIYVRLTDHAGRLRFGRVRPVVSP